MSLRLRDLRLDWGDFSLTGALDIAEGQVLAVIGPSGAGKSTLLSVLAGFAPEIAGTIHWQDQEISRLPPWQRPVAVLFQDANLFPHLSLLRNVALGLAPRRKPTAAEIATVEEMLTQVGLPGLGGRKPGQVSGGQQSRAALARVLLQDRPLVLLDEPFAALGPGLKDEMLRLAIGRLRAAGRTILLVTHDPDEARLVADGIVTVIGGQIDGPFPVSILDAPPPDLAAYLGR